MDMEPFTIGELQCMYLAVSELRSDIEDMLDSDYPLSSTQRNNCVDNLAASNSILRKLRKAIESAGFSVDF